MTSANQTISALQKASYGELFERMDDAARKEVLGTPDAAANLLRYVRDASAPAAKRFLAAELLFEANPGFPATADIPVVAGLYAQALAGSETGNRWGLPPGEVGRAGQHLLKLGKAAVPALRPLLGDARPIRYGGSEEASAAQTYQVRVKDLAAYFISKLDGKELPFDVDPGKRDQAIEGLKR